MHLHNDTRQYLNTDTLAELVGRLKQDRGCFVCLPVSCAVLNHPCRKNYIFVPLFPSRLSACYLTAQAKISPSQPNSYDKIQAIQQKSTLKQFQHCSKYFSCKHPLFQNRTVRMNKNKWIKLRNIKSRPKHMRLPIKALVLHICMCINLQVCVLHVI